MRAQRVGCFRRGGDGPSGQARRADLGAPERLPDAGSGFEERTRIHHTWETTAEYRARFGHFDYVYQTEPGGEWYRDAGSVPGPYFDARGVFIEAGGGSLAFGAVALPEEVVRACSFTLYPWCSNRKGDAISFIHWAWGKKEYIHLRWGRWTPSQIPREARRRLTEIRDGVEAADALRHDFTSSEDTLMHSKQDGTFQGRASDAVEAYLEKCRRVDDAYEALHAPEVTKIRSAVEALEHLV
jgi:hypothetical protein